MGISNFDNRIINLGATQNYTKFVSLTTQFESLSSSPAMLTNIDDMRIKLKGLLESGSIEKDTLGHQQLESICKSAMNIQARTSKSLNDTVEFYLSYNNFNDIVNRISGDVNV